MILTRRNCLSLCLRLYRRLVSSTTQVVWRPDLPASAFKPEVVQRNRYEKWEKEGRFLPTTEPSKPIFSMVLPPPNVTGKLHLGHALACTIQDVIVRRKKSMGYNVLWVPGTDHAGIATQGVVEKYLKTKQNVTRHQLGREKFISEVLKWREKHGDTINNQLRTLGCSLDWTRQTFTMDPKHTHAVNTAFINLFQKGLIYRKKALVNWCNALNSTVSDIEVENVNIPGPTDMNIPGYSKPVKFGLLYDFAYPIVAEKAEIVVSTTMPETMLGDTAIAVNPNDKRYENFIGKHALHPFRKTPIPIIANTFVDMSFGTGAVKITPAHSKVDYTVGKNHNLPSHEIISEEGLIKNSGDFNKLKRYECRELIIDKLEELGLLRKVTPHAMTLPICSRSGSVIDHILKEQWFVKCSKLNEKAAELAMTGKLNIMPDKFINYWLNWTADDRDWCISRQLWWGHQIPAYKCEANDNITWIAANDPKSAKQKASVILRAMPDEITASRDPDVLDTWFSSGIYPFAALGWPDYKPGDKRNNADYRHYYPLSLMATGHDILGFWVHRMVILGLELTGQLPFDNVLLHGIVCDSKGAKMSKSRGNVIDPIDVINGISMAELKSKSQDMKNKGILTKEELQKALAYHKSNFSNTDGIPECGVDALRFTLLSQDIKSHFINFDVAMCHANKLFCNKIWQSIRYTQIQHAKLIIIKDEITEKDLTIFDRWILSRMADMIDKVNTSMDAYNFHTATRVLRTFIYNEFCDKYLEATKPGFENNNVKMGYAHAHTLSAVLNVSLRSLAPIMVYLTDALIPIIPTFETNIIHSFTDHEQCYEFPQYRDFKKWKNEEAEARVEKLLSSVQMIRELKGLYNISNQNRPCVCFKSKDSSFLHDVEEYKDVIMHLTRCSDVNSKLKSGTRYAGGVLDKQTEIYLEIAGPNAANLIVSARNKIESRVRKLEDTLAKMDAKFKSKNQTSSELVQSLEKENYAKKRNELQQLQRLMPEKEKE